MEEKSTATEDEQGTVDCDNDNECDTSGAISIENVEKTADNNESTPKSEKDDIDLIKYAILLQQKDQIIQLVEREKKLLQDELDHFKSELKQATIQKEYFVLQFATKEKDLLDGRKERDHLQKQLDEMKKEVKNITVKYYAINEEKSRLISIIEEKCNEVKKCQKDSDKLKNDVNNLEMKLKWNVLKLNQETESRQVIEKQLKSAVEPSTVEQQRIEQEASVILLKHENEEKGRTIEKLTKDHQELSEKLTQLQLSFSREVQMKNSVVSELNQLKEEHNSVQNTLSQELLNSARLKNELEANKIASAQITIAEEKIIALNEKLEECEKERSNLLSEHNELNAVIERMSGAISKLHNEIALKNSKLTAIDAEISLLKKDKSEFDKKLKVVEDKLSEEIQKRNEEKLLLTKHLSEKTKLHEIAKTKLDDILGDLDATKKKHLQIVKELHREINKYRKHSSDQPESLSEDGKAETYPCSGNRNDNEVQDRVISPENGGLEQGPSKEHLVERILRLQQAAARQTEKIDFLENHTMSLVAELQKKSKILQYYMLRDHSGALTSSKSDQNKTELAKYGGVMSAIYTGIRGNNQSMTLDLSLEINKKLQAVLEDTILKNITLKENLDVMGLEIDRLIRQLPRQPTNGSKVSE